MELGITFHFHLYNTPVLTVCVQAGGQSSRMGKDKALKPFLGRPLIQRVIERIIPVADELIVTTNHPDAYTFLNTSTRSVRRLRLVSDLKPDRGALGGLYTAIASASNPIVAVVACDMPFASSALIEAANNLMVEEEADVVIARSTEGYEPLHAIYRRATCLPAIESAIDADQWKVVAWFPNVRVRELTAGELKQFDPAGLAFWNVNTPEEFAEAERISLSLEGRGPG
jgi:molybdopterin-guanine dinucleotide biosynthesis protein A